MPKLKIVTVPDPVLKSPCIEVTDFSGMAELGKQMLKLMEKGGGVGLAAPQVGLNSRVFVVSLTGKAADGKIFINPTISLSGDEVVGMEGCLSIPNVGAPIKRLTDAIITAKDVRGNPFTIEASGWLARIWQHENDHLNGILITDRYAEQNPTPNEGV